MTVAFTDRVVFRRYAEIDRTGECVQCGRCSSTCAVAFKTSDTPRKVIRHIQRDDFARAAGSPFLHLCKQCINCTVSCPRRIDVAGVMRSLVKARFLLG